MHDEFLKTDMESRAEILAQSDLFSKLDPESLRKVSGLCRDRFLREGEIIIKQGDEGKCLYVVVSGIVAVERTLMGQTETVLMLKPNRTFGWTSLIEPHALSATLRTQTPAHLLELEGADLKRLLDSDLKMGYEVMHQLSTIISRRLRLAYKMLEDKSEWEHLLL